ncbi:hypothetical protein LIPSTDRAFT_332819 [Lipomyces starkeyi NRRL Y-11557]|uniref:Uncharacterized protein n=1 Tax=Lipomyces starkeyi NRRL Y-11557 TaxID=675824 RepID=A0A1E3Q021_LIPST|nr:hypothetical protein LIPSTDRAFT_332819 [Lipomyces starkeyi NRRL Y-11557]
MAKIRSFASGSCETNVESIPFPKSLQRISVTIRFKICARQRTKPSSPLNNGSFLLALRVLYSSEAMTSLFLALYLVMEINLDWSPSSTSISLTIP